MYVLICSEFVAIPEYYPLISMLSPAINHVVDWALIRVDARIIENVIIVDVSWKIRKEIHNLTSDM